MRILLVLVGITFAQVKYLPTPIPGSYLGDYDGVQCYNCVPDMKGAVRVSLQDSLGGITLTLKDSVWNLIKKPIVEKQVFDFNNECFYFRYKEKDTLTVDGMTYVGKVKEVPCFPYERRVKEIIPVPVTRPSWVDSMGAIIVLDAMGSVKDSVKAIDQMNSVKGVKFRLDKKCNNLSTLDLQDDYIKYLRTQSKLQNDGLRFSGYMFLLSAASMAVGVVLGYNTYLQYKDVGHSIPARDLDPIASAFFISVVSSGAGGYSLISINF